MSVTVEPTFVPAAWVDGEDEVSAGEPTGFDRSAADHALHALWGIRPGHSSPVTAPMTHRFESGMAMWLYCLWGLDCR